MLYSGPRDIKYHHAHAEDGAEHYFSQYVLLSEWEMREIGQVLVE